MTKKEPTVFMEFTLRDLVAISDYIPLYDGMREDIESAIRELEAKILAEARR